MSYLETNLNEPKILNPIIISEENAKERLKAIPKWAIQEKSIFREFILQDFEEAMDFVNGVADIAALENHHPDIFISYNKVKVTLTTHKSGGLTNMDFEMAFKIDNLFPRN